MSAKYEMYTPQVHLQTSVKSDLNRIKKILQDEDIVYRQTKYFYEFVFLNTKWNRTIWTNLNRIQKRCINDVKIDKDINNNLSIMIERYKNIFSRGF